MKKNFFLGLSRPRRRIRLRRPVGQDTLEVETQMTNPHFPKNMSLESPSKWPIIAHLLDLPHKPVKTEHSPGLNFMAPAL